MPKRLEGSRHKQKYLNVLVMKKMILMVAFGAMMLVSCNNGLGEEGQKAWNKFKDLAAKFESVEAAEANFESAEDCEATYAEFQEASTDMAQYVFQITEAQADSFKNICETCAATYQQYVDEAAAATEEEEVEGEESEEEEGVEDVE